MTLLDTTLLIYLLLGAGVAGAVYLSDMARSPAERWFQVTTALIFWPLYVPLLLQSRRSPATTPHPPPTHEEDELTTAIARADGELKAALNTLDGWPDDVLQRERGRICELHAAWIAQAERIRDLDRLLASPEYSESSTDLLVGLPAWPDGAADHVSEHPLHAPDTLGQNVQRLREVRQRAYADLMDSLAGVRRLVAMIHLARFSGAPAARAQELVGQLAAAFEGLSGDTKGEVNP
jgi:hypothetical protein